MTNNPSIKIFLCFYQYMFNKLFFSLSLSFPRVLPSEEGPANPSPFENFV